MTHYLRFCALALLCATGAARAAAPVESMPAALAQAQGPSGGVNLTMEHRHALKELLLKDSKVKREGTQFDEGATIPNTIELHPIPALVGEKVPSIKNHSFVLTNDAVVIVGTQDRKVVEVVKEQ